MRSCFAFILFFYVADCKPFRYDYNFQAMINGWLKLQHIPATFHDAWLRCHLEGAVLASPSNIFIQSAMQKEMEKGRVSKSGVFTGIHATFSKGDFYSIEGVPLNNMELQWMPVEPDNKNNDEDCILYIANGTIADVRCTEIYPYFCFKENTPNIFVSGCGTVDKEYNYDARTGKCYKFHQVAKNWTRAFMTCAAEGGHLVIVNSKTEATILKELFAKNPVESIKYAVKLEMKNIIHIGYHDWNERGLWTTIHGTALKEAGYDIWASGQPNDFKPGQYCGGMSRQGELNDIWCHERGPFICEKSPESLQNDGDK